MEILVTVVGGGGEHSSPILFILAHPVVEKDAVFAGTGNYKVQKVLSKDPRFPCDRETEVPVAHWVGSQ